jgi:hypothetical protein
VIYTFHRHFPPDRPLRAVSPWAFHPVITLSTQELLTLPDYFDPDEDFPVEVDVPEGDEVADQDG